MSADGAAPNVGLSRGVGPPTTITTIKGQGFGPSETIDIKFDTLLLAMARTNAIGSFAKKIAVPSSALPGAHQVKAKGETSGLLASTVFTVRTDWPKFHFDVTNSGTNPYENVLSPSDVPGMTQRWATLTGGDVESSPTVVNGIVYVAAGNVGVGQAELYAIQAATGAVIWTQLVDGQDPSDPTVVGRTVYLGTLFDHSVRAFNASTGNLKWTFVGLGGMGTPVVSGALVYVGSNAGFIYAIDSGSGSQVWSADVGTDVSLSTPAVADGRIYVGGGDGNIFALDASTGSQVWAAPTGGYVYSSPAVVSGTVYVGSSDGKAYAFDSAAGLLIWSATTAGPILSSPAVWDGAVYIGSADHNVYAFDAATGASLWATSTGDAIQLGGPCVANGVVYIGSEDQKIYAIDAGSGAILWTFATGGLINTSPAIADGTLYIGSFDNYVYSFGLP